MAQGAADHAVSPFGAAQMVGRELAGDGQLGAVHVVVPQAPKHGGLEVGAAAALDRARARGDRPGRSQARLRPWRLAASRPAPPEGRARVPRDPDCRAGRDQRQSPWNWVMASCQRRASRGRQASAMPVLDRLTDKAGLGAVLGQELRLCAGPLGELRLEHRDDTGLELLTPALQECGIGDVAHQGVLEAVAARSATPTRNSRSAATSRSKASASGVPARARWPRAGHGRIPARGRRRSAPPRGPVPNDRAARPGNPAGTPGWSAPRASAVPCSNRLASSTALVSSSRNSGTPSALATTASMASAESGVAAVSCFTTARASAASRRSRDRVVACVGAGPGWHEFRPEADDQEYGQRAQLLDDQVQQLERGRIAPVCVLEHQEHRPAAGQTFKLVEQCRQRPLPLGLWPKGSAG